MEENLGAFEEKRNEAAETAESAGKGGKHLAKVGKRGWAIAGIALNAILPGNDYEFDSADGSDAPSSANLQV